VENFDKAPVVDEEPYEYTPKVDLETQAVRP
jgi:hypothetical protein